MDLNESLKVVRELIENDQLIIFADTTENGMILLSGNDVIKNTCINGNAIQIALDPDKNLIKMVKP